MARGGNQGGRSSLQHLARRALLIGKYLCVGNRRKSAKNTFGCQSRVRCTAVAQDAGIRVWGQPRLIRNKSGPHPPSSALRRSIRELESPAPGGKTYGSFD